MKKVLFIIFILSVTVFSNGYFEANEDILENQFELKYPIISDGVTQINNIDYDVTISPNKAFLEIEIESVFGDANWSKINKQALETVLLELVTDIRTEVNNPTLSVTVFIKLDREVGSDKILLNKTY
ncbi:hypothetical protein PM10SUCC1_02410 [Propionigenium maris DSM 9537]|uniref:Uncharacterized protein n=1 Tax=Propionigenium maris DSM 9537 TaxID=1123000 RepID=A0A9W6GJ64_9FUSO|nr:hypothetical protein [Propionigenium maris]GLI54726.1 hypothetical protein PM10SUCC1_02410 [Propionigenium maris DSM 9537]